MLCVHAAGVGWAVETRCMGVGTNYRALALARGGEGRMRTLRQWQERRGLTLKGYFTGRMISTWRIRAWECVAGGLTKVPGSTRYAAETD